MTNSIPSYGSPKSTRALLSIKPQFASRILDRTKKFEYRRRIFSRKVDTVVMYVTAPVSRVVAEFDVADIISAPPTELWKETHGSSGITKDFFFDYFDGCETAHAIRIGAVREYDNPYSLQEHFGIRPPQSFVYLHSGYPQ